MAVPIWKDKEVTLGSGDAYDYEIRLGSSAGAAIYAGRAYKRPDAASTVVRINDVCADWLAAGLPALAPVGFTVLDFAAKFSVCAYDGGAWVEKAHVEFYSDWSYDRDFNPATDPISCPVNGVADPRQVIIVSVLNAVSVTANLTYTDGTTATVVIPVAHSADFNDDFNDDFSDYDTGAQSGAAVIDLSQWSGLASIAVAGVTYDVLPEGCGRYLLYYVNARGGWDSLLLDGVCKTADSLERHTALLEFDNNDAAARGWKDYAVEVARTWELSTGLLEDAESARMHHLLNSVQVYLADLATGDVIPVVLTDTDHARQTFQGEGRRFPRYTFNAKEAQPQVRR